MPNYNITIDSRFDPYSFEDYLKPLAILQEQHNQAADAYANYLAQSAGMEEALAANPDDIDLLNQYNTYRQTLNNLADDLSKNGISRTTRRGAHQAKADYGNIAKMQEAIKTRAELIKEQRGLLTQDNSLLFDRDAANTSISSILKGNSTYNTVSRNAIKKSTMEDVVNWAKSAYVQYKGNPEFEKKWGWIFETDKVGATPEQIAEAINSADPSDPIAKQLRQIAVMSAKKYMGNGDFSDTQKDQMLNASLEGLYSAIGTETRQHMQDFLLQDALKRSYEKTPKSATPLSMRYNQLYFGDKAKDRTGMTNVFERFYTDSMNKTFQKIMNRVANMSPEEFKKYSTEHKKELGNMLGLNTTHRDFINFGNPERMRPQIDGVDVSIAVAERMGLGDDIVEKLNNLHSKIKSTFNGQRARYEPTQEDVKLLDTVWSEYNRRNNEANALHALSFELPFTSTDNHEVFMRLINAQQSGYTTDWRNKWREIKEIQGYTEDGYPRLGKSLKEGDVDEKDNFKNNRVSFSAVPMEVKVKDAKGKVIKDEKGEDVVKNTMRFIMHLNGKMYNVPEEFIPENLRPNLSMSVSNYIDTQMDYDLWARDKDFNNLSDEDQLKYSDYNAAIGYGSQSMGRQAAIALFGPNWAFDKQKVLQ